MTKPLSFAALLALFSGVGCGGATGDSNPPSAPIANPIRELRISPNDTTLELGVSATFVARVTYADDTEHEAAADWDSGTPGVVSVNGVSPSTTVQVVAAGLGTTILTASFKGHSASATIRTTWTLPSDPGPVFGHEAAGDMVAYPPMGGGARVTVGNVGATAGFTMNRGGTALYASGAGVGLVRQSLTGGSSRTVATLPFEYTFAFGMDYDSKDRIYIAGGTVDLIGRIYRYDPAKNPGESGTIPIDDLGVMTRSGPGGSVALGWQVALTVAADDSIYTLQGYGPGIYRHKVSDGPGVQSSLWGVLEASFFNQGGVSINALGELFAIPDIQYPEIWKHMDVNGDGDAFDDGEARLWALAPGVTGDLEALAFGITVTHGGGILVNVRGGGPTFTYGIYWMVDRNGDDYIGNESGDEVRLYNAQNVTSGTNGHCIAAPK